MICLIKGHTPNKDLIKNIRIENISWTIYKDAHSILAADCICNYCGINFKYKERLPWLLHVSVRETFFKDFLKSFGIN